MAKTIDQALRGRGAGEGDGTMQLGMVGLQSLGGSARAHALLSDRVSSLARSDASQVIAMASFTL